MQATYLGHNHDFTSTGVMPTGSHLSLLQREAAFNAFDKYALKTAQDLRLNALQRKLIIIIFS